MTSTLFNSFVFQHYPCYNMMTLTLFNSSVFQGHPCDNMMTFTLESFVILFLTTCIIVTNILILLVLFRTEHFCDGVNKYFFTSLTVSDLCIGLLITPFSFWASIFGDWIYGDKFCHLQAYLCLIFLIASVYSLAWIGVDHYVAIRKPDRYESLMTPMRSICWVVLIWVAALSFCCPPLFGDSRAQYYTQAYVCILSWAQQKAYIVTSGIMLIGPAIICVLLTNMYMFTESYQQKKSLYEKCSDTNSRTECYFVNSLITICYVLTWTPWSALQLHEFWRSSDDPLAPDSLHFYLMWLCIANSMWKFVIYTVFDHNFRIGLKILYLRISCSPWA